MVQIVTLTGTLTDTGEDGVTTVGLGDVVDELLDEDGLADTGTAEETNLSTTGVGGKEIDDLDTGDENLGSGGLLNELGGIGVDGKSLVGLDGSSLVNRVTGDVDDATKSGRADARNSSVSSPSIPTRPRAISDSVGGGRNPRDGDGSTSCKQSLAGCHKKHHDPVLAERGGELTVGSLGATDQTLGTCKFCSEAISKPTASRGN